MASRMKEDDKTVLVLRCRYWKEKGKCGRGAILFILWSFQALESRFMYAA